MILSIERLSPNAKIPTRATAKSAGLDLYACLDEAMCIPAGQTRSVPTGIAIALPGGTAGFVYARSGLGIKMGVAPANCVGVIDGDYRGELIVGLYNHSDTDYTIEPGERIAQLVVAPVLAPDITEVESLPGTARGKGGFGSTGRM